MNEFQKTLQKKFYAQMDADPNDTEVMVLYINYLSEMLGAGFLSELEEKRPISIRYKSLRTSFSC